MPKLTIKCRLDDLPLTSLLSINQLAILSDLLIVIKKAIFAPGSFDALLIILWPTIKVVPRRHACLQSMKEAQLKDYTPNSP